MYHHNNSTSTSNSECQQQTHPSVPMRNNRITNTLEIILIVPNASAVSFISSAISSNSAASSLLVPFRAAAALRLVAAIASNRSIIPFSSLFAILSGIFIINEERIDRHRMEGVTNENVTETQTATINKKNECTMALFWTNCSQKEQTRVD